MRVIGLVLLALGASWGANCNRTSTGMVAFTTPFAPSYKGQQVSLYPNGNVRPAVYESMGLQQAGMIQPLDANGNASPTGRIVFLSVGMSNTTMEFSAFIPMAQTDPLRNPQVQPVDGAVGGMTAALIASQPDKYWPQVDQRLQSANATAAQVQAIWLKEADSNPTQPFPDHALALQSEIETIIRQAQARFPNLRIVYLSSRIYAGYATTALNPEPYAYEGGFAVKWLIEKQINGISQVSPGPAAFPWVAWGPYLWADGLNARSDGLAWACADLRDTDGTHPSESGQKKVAAMLLDFLHSDSTARVWYLKRQTATAPVIGAVVNSASWARGAAAGSVAAVFGIGFSGSALEHAAFPLTHELAGTRVLVNGVPALLYYISPTQINFVVPPPPYSSNATQNQVAVARGDTASDVADPGLALWAPGLYTLDSSIGGPLAAMHADGGLVSASSPAHPGEILFALGTGLGVINPALMIPVPAPTVRVGAVDAQDVSATDAVGLPGITLIRFTLPSNAPVGSAVPVTFHLGTSSSNAGIIPITQ